MNDRDERRFAEVSHESVRLMAESAGVELDDDVAALLAEDVCYRLREATQVGAGSGSGSGSRRDPSFSLHIHTHPHFVSTEQLSVHETRQKEKADGGGLQQSSALEQRGGSEDRSTRRDRPTPPSKIRLVDLFLPFPSTCQAIFGCGAQEATPFRSLKDGELFLVEDRDVNLVELALATNIPKGCAETVVRGESR